MKKKLMLEKTRVHSSEAILLVDKRSTSKKILAYSSEAALLLITIFICFAFAEIIFAQVPVDGSSLSADNQREGLVNNN